MDFINRNIRKINLSPFFSFYFFFGMLVFINGCVAENNNEVNSATKKSISNNLFVYPNIWDYKSKENDLSPSLYWRTPNNDIVVLTSVVIQKEGDAKKEIVSVRSFFSRKDYMLTTEEEMKVNGFIKLRTIYGRKKFNYSEGRFVKNNSVSRSKCSDTFSDYLEISDEKNNSLKKFRILYLSDNPKRIDQKYCEGGSEYYQKVTSLRLQFTSLRDGTFIASSTEEDIAIRFNGDFSSESKLIGDKIFILPFDLDPYKELGLMAEEHAKKKNQQIYLEYLLKLKGK